jgi:hypothetical protein
MSGPTPENRTIHGWFPPPKTMGTAPPPKTMSTSISLRGTPTIEEGLRPDDGRAGRAARAGSIIHP